MATVMRWFALFVLAGGLIALSGGTTHAQETTTVPVGDVWFCNASFVNGVCETTITAGDTVVWDFGAGSLPHTTTACGASCDNPTGSPLWDSGVINDDSTFSQTFNDPGEYLYRCDVHPAQMRGRIVVEAAGAVETPTAAPDATVAPPSIGLPVGPDGGGRDIASSAAGAAAAAGALAIAFGGAAWYALRRR